jgi:hypothetical protein
MITKHLTKQFRNFRINFVSEVYEGEIMDTEVTILPNRITNETMFVISGNDIERFTNEFETLVNRYAI